MSNKLLMHQLQSELVQHVLLGVRAVQRLPDRLVAVDVEGVQIGAQSECR
jgi:hypothetical protein